MSDALTLSGDEQLPIVRVRASAVFSILSSFTRRNDKQARVIGTLLGSVKDGNIIEVKVEFVIYSPRIIKLCFKPCNTRIRLRIVSVCLIKKKSMSYM